ncbi:hypothetical protein LCGC14_2441510 [marine sediment metagenome]|uniref:Uncharacterized protein n=1 Tax=marine sediment metagenome TaxID=412755 RepID=A0A0F9ECU5_9ZZZZ
MRVKYVGTLSEVFVDGRFRCVRNKETELPSSIAERVLDDHPEDFKKVKIGVAAARPKARGGEK